MGDNFIAVGTSSNTVRLLRLSGLQFEALVMPGPIVSISVTDHLLAIVCHLSNPVNDKQILGLRVFNVEKMILEYDGYLPSGEKNCELRWIGFNDFQMVITLDANLKVYCLSTAKGNQWIPMANIGKQLENKETFYPIGCYQDKLVGVTCPKKTYPLVTPKPLTTTLALKASIVNILVSDNPQFDQKIKEEIGEMAVDIATNKIFLNETNFLLNSASYNGDMNLEGKARELRAAIDKSAYSIFYYLNESQPLLGYDVATQINTPKAMQLCIDCAKENDSGKLAKKLETLYKSKFGN
ncbi:hypothetical protein MHBO_001449 [Bonamia ostreae]|uniref:WDHD1/CFT4 second beta-propeller domain-containing protein n=1 Tax=Bonamia ostreae TaxID=126728 RepID=A0ABV2AJ12_9EUKA